MKKGLLFLSIAFLSITAYSQTPVDTADLRLKINSWLVPNSNREITALKVNQLFNGVASLMKAYAIDSSYRIADTLFLTRRGFTTLKVILNAAHAVQLSDSSFRVGNDTIVIHDQNIATASLTATGDYTQNWNSHQLNFQAISNWGLDAKSTEQTFGGRNIHHVFTTSSNFYTQPMNLYTALRNVSDVSDSLIVGHRNYFAGSSPYAGLIATRDGYTGRAEVGLYNYSINVGSAHGTTVVNGDTSGIYLSAPDSVVASAPGLRLYNTTGDIRLGTGPGVAPYATWKNGGRLLIGTTTDDGAAKLQINATLGSFQKAATINVTGTTAFVAPIGMSINESSTTGGYGLQVFSTNGYGVAAGGKYWGVSGSVQSTAQGVYQGAGVVGYSDGNTTAPGLMSITNGSIASQNTVLPGLDLWRGVKAFTNTAGGGIALRTFLPVYDPVSVTTQNPILANTIQSVLTNISGPSYTTDLLFTGPKDSVYNTLLTLKGGGQLQGNQYTGGNFETTDTSMPAAVFGTDGKIYKRRGDGGGTTVTASNGLTKVGNDIRLGGTLSGNTDIDLNGKVLTFFNEGVNSGVVYDLNQGVFDVASDKNVSIYGADSVTLTTKPNENGLPKSEIKLLPDSMRLLPNLGIINVDTIIKGTITNKTALTWDTLTKRLVAVPVSSFVAPLQAVLTAGSTLTSANTIAAGSNAQIFSSTAASGAGYSFQNTGNGNALSVTTTGSLPALSILNTADGVLAATIKANTSSTFNAVTSDVLEIRRGLTSGTASNGIGGNISFRLPTDAGNEFAYSMIQWSAQSVANGARSGKLAFGNWNSGTYTEGMVINSTGQLKLTQYGSNFDVIDTTTYKPLAINNVGTVVKMAGWPAVGGGGTKVKFVQTATTNVTADDNETTLIGTGVGSLTIPANTMQAGKSYRLTVRGKYGTSSSNPAQMNWRMYLGSTVVEASGNAGLGTNKVDKGYQITADLTCRTTGSSGSVMAQGMFFTEDGPGAKNMPATLTTINTTIDQTFNFTVDLTDGSTGNNCYVYILTFEEI